MDALSLLVSTFSSFWTIFADSWWIWVPIILFFSAWDLFVHYNRTQYFTTLKWVLLEIKFPAEPHKSFNAMEQIFTALHVTPLPPKNLRERWTQWKAKYIEGKIPNWYSFEMVSINGEIHFYVRTVEDNKNVVQSQIYAHYPESEISQVADHIAGLPSVLPSGDYDATGAELALIKDDVFPIKTYPEFEEEGGGKEDVRRIDPLAPIAETFASIGFGEYLGIEVLIRGTGGDWIKKGQNELNKLMGRPEKPPEANALDKMFQSIDQLILPPASQEKKEEKPFNQLNPGIQDAVKAIERSFTKLAFETGVRIFYAAPKDRFGKDRVPAILAGFKQFATHALNGFKPDMPEVKKGWNKEEKTLHKKEQLFQRYLSREFPKKPFVLNTEEVTTIWHFPDISVKTPSLPRIEAKKGEPPAGLPTV